MLRSIRTFEKISASWITEIMWIKFTFIKFCWGITCPRFDVLKKTAIMNHWIIGLRLWFRLRVRFNLWLLTHLLVLFRVPLLGMFLRQFISQFTVRHLLSFDFDWGLRTGLFFSEFWENEFDFKNLLNLIKLEPFYNFNKLVISI